MANRLIALDKSLGLRPIGIGESLQRVLGNAVRLVTGDEIRAACGSDQLCAGLEAGIEGAIHSLNNLFVEHKGSGWGVLVVDVSNAFQCLESEGGPVAWETCLASGLSLSL